ncbi:Interferon-induced protein with tetratricopeptide repeats 5, partial [Acanthisitta chloris]
STISKNSLETSLLQLQCHFTWALQEQDVDLDCLEEKTVERIEFSMQSNSNDYNLLAYVCHLKNSNEEALKNLQKAEQVIQKHHPDESAGRNLVTWGNYAWIYYHMERYEEAQIYISKVADISKSLSSTADGKIQLPEVYCGQGWALLHFGEKYYERAKECFEIALKKEPNNPDFNASYAIAMYRLEKIAYRYNEEAVPSFELLKRAVELNPQDTSLMALLALKLQDLQQVAEGEMYIEAAMQKTPDHPYFLRYAGVFYRRKGEVDKAVEILKKALRLAPNCNFLHHQLGICYRGKMLKLKNTSYPPQKQVEELIQLATFHFKIVVDRRPKFFTAHTDLANMYAEGKRYEEAEETFQKVLHRDDLPRTEKQLLYFNYGNFQRFHMKSVSKAIHYYIEGLKIEKDSYGRNKCRDALKKLLEQKIQRGSGNATDFGILGLVHKLTGKKHEAIECYEKAIELDPNNEDYRNALFELRLSI